MRALTLLVLGLSGLDASACSTQHVIPEQPPDQGPDERRVVVDTSPPPPAATQDATSPQPASPPPTARPPMRSTRGSPPLEAICDATTDCAKGLECRPDPHGYRVCQTPVAPNGPPNAK